MPITKLLSSMVKKTKIIPAKKQPKWPGRNYRLQWTSKIFKSTAIKIFTNLIREKTKFAGVPFKKGQEIVHKTIKIWPAHDWSSHQNGS